MTITQAAAALGKSEQTLRRWIDDGYVRAMKIGKMWEVSDAEVQRIKAGDAHGTKGQQHNRV